MAIRRFSPLLFAPVLLTAACSDGADQSSSDLGETHKVRIVEVLGNPTGDSTSAFVELRNDADDGVSLKGWTLKVGTAQGKLAPRAIKGSVAEARGQDGSVVQGHGLALVVDAGVSDADVERFACESPIATTQASLGSKHADSDDITVSQLMLQAQRHCLPVFDFDEKGGLGKRLEGSDSLSLYEQKEKRDAAKAAWGKAPKGVSYERNGLETGAFALSPIGATPGTRNFFSSDPDEVSGHAPPPVRALSSSPWRVGNEILELQRKGAAEDQIKALQNGEHLPENPLVQPFVDTVKAAKRSAVGAFYQINDKPVIASLVEAKKSEHVEVEIATDANFKNDPNYVDGLRSMSEAKIPLFYDEQANGTNRLPLMHHKFLSLDGEWLWAGSFNPIEDEPSRIHADNAVLLHSPALAGFYKKEFDVLSSGQWGIMKRGQGIGGGAAWVDGARVDVRFSPGITEDQLKRRGAELARTGDPVKACAVVGSNKKSVLEDRYKDLDPCGGPLDLIVGEVARATSSIYFVSFSLALEEVADIMVERHKTAGVDVKGVVDPTVAGRGAPQQILEVGDVRATPNSDPTCPAYVKPKTNCPKNPNKVWLHHKFVLIDYGTDHPVVLTGSHNMSDSAELQNDEALIVIRDRAVAEVYYRMFREAFDHPQTLGPKRDMKDLPALAITEVRGSADPGQAQFVEVQNLGESAANLQDLELWNRSSSVSLSGGTVAPGGRAVIAIGDSNSLGLPSGVPVVSVPADATTPFVGLRTALVLRAHDGRWVSTFDPYTSEQNLPEGVSAPTPGDAWQWLGFDRSALESAELELLGNNVTPDAAVPTWQPRGFFSDWADEHDVTDTGMVLMRGVSDAWTPAPDHAGSPGN